MIRQHVLLVEDDPWFAEQMMRVLSCNGYTSRCVSNVYDAMDAIDERPPRVLILDMLLPVASGVTLLQELQSYDDTSRIPVVVCTSLASDVTIDMLEPYGVSRLLDKITMEPSDVIAAVRAVT